MNWNEKVDAYLLGQLNEEDHAAFSKRLLIDSTLAKEVEKRNLILQGIEALGNETLRNRIKKVRREMNSSTESSKSTNQKSHRSISITRMAGIAAAIIGLGCMIWYLFPTQKNNANYQSLYTNHYQPYNLHLTTRESHQTESVFKIQMLYQNQKYKEVIPLLEARLSEQEQDGNLELALGSAYFQTGETEKAIREFLKIIDREDPLYIDQANWYLVFCYLKNNQVELAKRTLTKLSETPGADHQVDAKKLLKEL